MRFIHLFAIIILLSVTSCQQKVSGRLTNHELLTIDNNVGEDSSMLALIKPYRDTLNLLMDEVIGYNEAFMRSEKPESPLSNFVADLVLEAGVTFLAESGISGSEVMSVINVRGLRAPLLQGNVTMRNAFEVMPFENQMTLVKLNGMQLKRLFVHITKSQGDGISGAAFTMAGENAENITVGGKPVTDNTEYWVVTSDYLANGGDGYDVFQESEHILTADAKIRDLIIAHIKSLQINQQPIVADRRVRITVAN